MLFPFPFWLSLSLPFFFTLLLISSDLCLHCFSFYPSPFSLSFPYSCLYPFSLSLPYCPFASILAHQPYVLIHCRPHLQPFHSLLSLFLCFQLLFHPSLRFWLTNPMF